MCTLGLIEQYHLPNNILGIYNMFQKVFLQKYSMNNMGKHISFYFPPITPGCLSKYPCPPEGLKIVFVFPSLV